MLRPLERGEGKCWLTEQASPILDMELWPAVLSIGQRRWCYSEMRES